MARPASESVIVLITVNDHETQAVLNAFLGQQAKPPQKIIDGITYNLLGLHGDSEIVQTICEMGAGGLGASQQRTRDAIDHWKPAAVIAVGIAFGMDEEAQKIGDVLVSTQLVNYDLGKVNENGELIPRGDRPSCAPRLLNRFRQTDTRGQRANPTWPRLTFGPVLSGQKLVDNLNYRASLKTLCTEAVGGEMEATGVYVSAAGAKVDWIVVKAICDWGHNKSHSEKEAWQKLAAKNAASVVKEALDGEGLYGEERMPPNRGLGRYIPLATLLLLILFIWKLWSPQGAKRADAASKSSPTTGEESRRDERTEVSPSEFSDTEMGIAVFEISDDGGKSQKHLKSTLETALSKEAPRGNIVVKAYPHKINDSEKVSLGHTEARQFGKQVKAQLAIWGTRAGEKGFHPRITIVNEVARGFPSERNMTPQDISGVELPIELIDSPLYLIHFIAGMTLFLQNNFPAALESFDQALQRKTVPANEAAYVHFFAGICHLSLAEGTTLSQFHSRAAISNLLASNISSQTQNMAAIYYNLGVAYAQLGQRTGDLMPAINQFDRAARFWGRDENPLEWLQTRLHIAKALVLLSGKNRAQNCSNAVMILSDALNNFPEGRSPFAWAAIQKGLAVAYMTMPSEPTGKNLNLQSALKSISTASRFYAQRGAKDEWASCQYIEGQIYRKLDADLSSENHYKAVLALTNALKVHTKDSFPRDWAGIMLELGILYAHAPGNNQETMLRMAIGAYKDSLKVFSKEEFPVEWAMIQNNLGNIYGDPLSGPALYDPKLAIVALKQASDILTEAEFPFEWSRTQASLGDTHRDMLNKAESLTAYHNALRGITESEFPLEWVEIQFGLAVALRIPSAGDYLKDLRESFNALKRTTNVWTETGYPKRWVQIQIEIAEMWHRAIGTLWYNRMMAINVLENAIRVAKKEDLKEELYEINEQLGNLWFEDPGGGNRAEALRRAKQFVEVALQYKPTSAASNLLLSIQRELLQFSPDTAPR